jgi:hypothetical protein
MTSTTGLAAPHWTASQNQPDVTHNSALDVLDSCIARQNVIDFPSDADYTLVTSGAYPREWQHAVIEMTDTGVVLTAARNVIVPANPRMWNAYNNTAQILTFKTSGGTGIAVGVGKRAILQNDGTNVVRWTADL